MDAIDKIKHDLELLKNTHRHDQRGYFAVADAPQRGSVANIAVSTGWWELDQIWKIYAGQFTIVTGIPGHGKSTLLLNVICNVAKKHDLRSFLYVPENESFLRETLRPIYADDENFDHFIGNQCFMQCAEVSDFQDQPKTLPWVLERAIIAIKKDGVGLLMIDPWNELEHAKPRDLTMTDYIRDCLMYLKQFCRAYNVAVILVAHPTKAGVSDGKVPNLSDVEGSMSWYNKCDNGLIVVRDQEHPTARVISAKTRYRGAGRRGVCHFHVDPETGKFTPQHGAVSL
jgi:twinkle protein